MGTFITDGAAVLPDVKADERPGTGAITEWAAEDANDIRTALLDLRTAAIGVQTGFVNPNTASVKSSGTPGATKALQDWMSALESAEADITTLQGQVGGSIDANALSVTATGTTTARTLANRFTDLVSPKDFGAVGNGTADDTAAVQAAITALQPYQTLELNGQYKITSALLITDKSNVRITGAGKVFLSGAASSSYLFQLTGTCTDVEIDGLHLEGDALPTGTQTAIGNASSGPLMLVASSMYFHDLDIRNINVGISLNADLGGSYTKAHVYDNTLTNILGTVSGSGYGIHMANATNVIVSGNVIDNCGRHSIYQGKGYDARVLIVGNSVTNHRSSVHDGSIRSAIVVSRSSNVTVANNLISDYYDGGLEISHVTSEGYNCYDVTVTGNKFTNRKNAVYSIILGEQFQATSYMTSNVSITNNSFYENYVEAAGNSNILMFQGKYVSIRNNAFRRTGITTVLPSSIDVGYYLYTTTSDLDQVVIENNVASADADVANSGFIYLENAVCQGTKPVAARRNTVYGYAKEVNFASPPTNQALKLKFAYALTYDSIAVAAYSTSYMQISVPGCKRTSSVNVRPDYSILVNGLSFLAYAKSSSDNVVILEATNSTGAPIDPASGSFIFFIEDL